MNENTEKFINKQAKLITSFLGKHLDQNFKGTDFLKASRYAIGPEGHRYRSILSLEIYKSLGGNAKDFIKALVGIEYVHHSTLIFDDLPAMDNSKMRKGKSTVHLAFGESTAILASLYLLEKGRLLLYESASEHLRGESLDEFQKKVCNSLIELLSGQEADLKTQKTPRELLTMMQNKNRMFYLACVIPSYLMKKKYFKEFNYLGNKMSTAYQFLDDLRDLQPSSITGKPKNQDKGKNTSLSKFGEKGVRKKLENTKQDIFSKLPNIKRRKEIHNLIEFILSHES